MHCFNLDYTSFVATLAICMLHCDLFVLIMISIFLTRKASICSLGQRSKAPHFILYWISKLNIAKKVWLFQPISWLPQLHANLIICLFTPYCSIKLLEGKQFVIYSVEMLCSQ